MSKTILLADDSLTIQKVVELTFAETDYEVVALSSGDELLQRLPETRPDLVICDIIMPGKDGYEVCQEIKSDPATLHIPVILLSGTFEPFDRDRALAAGCSDIITKPFEARKLVDTVEGLLVGGSGESPVPIEGTVEPPPVEPVVPPTEPPAEQLRPPAEPPLAADSIAPEPGVAADEYVPDTELEHGLDFTDTGFAEMEAAGGSDADASAVGLPEEGLDFEFSDDFEAFEESVPSEEVESADTEPELEPAVEHDTSTPPPAPEPEFPPQTDPVPSPDPYLDVSEPAGPFPEPSLDDSRPSLAADTHEPFIPGFEAEPASALAEASVSSPTPVVAEDEPIASLPTSPDEFEVPGPELPPEIEFEGDEDSSNDVSDADADTAPVPSEAGVAEAESEPTLETPDLEPSAAPAIGTGPSLLSEQDIDRIARRILELSADRIENIAWEVVPDMAEVVVRRRIRELEAEAENAAAESHPD